jgi:hypothetical protein
MMMFTMLKKSNIGKMDEFDEIVVRAFTGSSSVFDRFKCPNQDSFDGENWSMQNNQKHQK